MAKQQKSTDCFGQVIYFFSYLFSFLIVTVLIREGGVMKTTPNLQFQVTKINPVLLEILDQEIPDQTPVIPEVEQFLTRGDYPQNKGQNRETNQETIEIIEILHRETTGDLLQIIIPQGTETILEMKGIDMMIEEGMMIEVMNQDIGMIREMTGTTTEEEEIGIIQEDLLREIIGIQEIETTEEKVIIEDILEKDHLVQKSKVCFLFSVSYFIFFSFFSSFLFFYESMFFTLCLLFYIYFYFFSLVYL